MRSNLEIAVEVDQLSKRYFLRGGRAQELKAAFLNLPALYRGALYDCAGAAVALRQ